MKLRRFNESNEYPDLNEIDHILNIARDEDIQATIEKNQSRNRLGKVSIYAIKISRMKRPSWVATPTLMHYDPIMDIEDFDAIVVQIINRLENISTTIRIEGIAYNDWVTMNLEKNQYLKKSWAMNSDIREYRIRIYA